MWLSAWRKPLGDAALWIAVGTAAAYVVGALYLHGYYAKFDLPETELHFSVPYVLESSFLPLMIPLFWLAMVAAVCRLFRDQIAHPADASPFFPIPTVKAVAYTFGISAAVTFSKVVYGPQETLIWGWTPLNLIAVAVAVTTFLIVYRNAKRSHEPNFTRPLRTTTWTVTSTILFAWTIGFASVLTGPKSWPYSAWESAFLVLATGYASFMILYDWRNHQQATAETGEWTTPKVAGMSYSPAASIFLVVLAILGLLLHAGLTGTAAGQEALAGCRAQRTIQFQPVPPGVEANETLRLIIHQNGIYYVWREVGSSHQTLMVPEIEGMTASLGWALHAHC